MSLEVDNLVTYYMCILWLCKYFYINDSWYLIVDLRAYVGLFLLMVEVQF